MDWLKRLFGKKIVTAEPVLGANTFDRVRASERALRRGMWVIVKSSSNPVGILTGLASDGSARVMLVDKHGHNHLEVDLPDASLRQAHLWEIPARRRPDKSVAKAYGYRTEPKDRKR